VGVFTHNVVGVGDNGAVYKFIVVRIVGYEVEVVLGVIQADVRIA